MKGVFGNNAQDRTIKTSTFVFQAIQIENKKSSRAINSSECPFHSYLNQSYCTSARRTARHILAKLLLDKHPSDHAYSIKYQDLIPIVSDQYSFPLSHFIRSEATTSVEAASAVTEAAPHELTFVLSTKKQEDSSLKSKED